MRRPNSDEPQQATVTPLPGLGEMTVIVTADATAIGADTYTSIDAVVRLLDRGVFSISFGAITVAAMGSAAAGMTAYASAQTDIAFDQADYLFTHSFSQTGSASAGGMAWMSEMVTTSFVAVDLHGFTPAGGTLGAQESMTRDLSVAPMSISGALATFAVDSLVQGNNTLNLVSADALAVSNQLSASYAQVVASVNSGVHPNDAVPLFVQGGRGADLLVGKAGDDMFLCGNGNDTVQGGQGDNTGFGGAGNDLMAGGDGDDWFFGDAGNDRLLLGDGRNIGLGGAGNDTLHGGRGDDILVGGAGDDLIIDAGGNNLFILRSMDRDAGGNDTCQGGSGADWYVVGGDAGRDVIRDFNLAQGDRLVFLGQNQKITRATAEDMVSLRTHGDDLVLIFGKGCHATTITFDDFFQINATFRDMRAGRPLDLPQEERLLEAIALGASADAVLQEKNLWLMAASTLDILF